MDKDFALMMEVQNAILEVVDAAEDLDRSDLQGRAMVVARNIINSVRA
jgi:hypothetical protein